MAGRPKYLMSCELKLFFGRPLRLARLRCERGSVVVVSPAAPVVNLTDRRRACDA